MNKKANQNTPVANPELAERIAKRLLTNPAKPQASKEAVFNLDPFIARFTQEKLNEWKAQFPGRDLIALSADGKLAVLRPPTADDLSDYMTAIGTNGINKAVLQVIQDLWLDGDFELIDDEDLFIAVFLQINNILEGKKAEYFRF